MSVIVPVLDNEPGARACASAVARQSYPAGIELVLVDNGSRPALPEISVSGEISVRTLRCSTPGSYAARNQGAAAATGTVLAFTDADCIPDADWLAFGVSALLAGEDRWIVGGDVGYLPPVSRSATALYQYEAGFGQRDNVERRGFCATANLLCSRSQFLRVGPFDERLLSGGDLEWCQRARGKGFELRFEPAARVVTQPRDRLVGAIRQARRVAAGRIALGQTVAEHLQPTALRRRRSAFQALRWILSRPSLSGREKAKVFAVAALIRAAEIIERIRLAAGLPAERR